MTKPKALKALEATARRQIAQAQQVEKSAEKNVRTGYDLGRAQGLREAANWLEANPELSIEKCLEMLRDFALRTEAETMK